MNLTLRTETDVHMVYAGLQVSHNFVKLIQSHNSASPYYCPFLKPNVSLRLLAAVNELRAFCIWVLTVFNYPKKLLLFSLGLNGRICVLRSICEVASVPFYYGNSVLAEIAHIIMTPSLTFDDSNISPDNEYYNAEMLGRRGRSCSYKFRECRHSLITKISRT